MIKVKLFIQALLAKRKHYVYSVALHFCLFIVLFFSIDFAPIKPAQPKLADAPAPKRIVQAGLVNKDAIDKAFHRQKQQEQQRKNEIARQQRAAQQAQKKAEALKKETQKLRNNIASQKRQSELELKKAQDAKRAAQEAKQKELKAKEAVEAARTQAAKVKQEAEKKQAEISEAQKRLKAQQEKEAAELQAQAAQNAANQKRLQWLNEEVEKYKAQIARQVYDNRTLSAAFASDLYCEIHIRLLPDGSINSVEIVRSSGNEAYDNSAEIAVYKAAPFIMPSETDLVQKLRDIVLGFKNDGQASS